MDGVVTLFDDIDVDVATESSHAFEPVGAQACLVHPSLLLLFF